MSHPGQIYLRFRDVCQVPRVMPMMLALGKVSMVLAVVLLVGKIKMNVEISRDTSYINFNDEKTPT